MLDGVILVSDLLCSHKVRFDDADPEQHESETAEAHYVWQYFTVTKNTVRIQRNGCKNCIFLL